MGLFGLFNKNKQPEKAENRNQSLLLAMPMFNNNETFDSIKVVDYLKNNWKCNVTNIDGNNSTLSLSVNGETIVLGTIDKQIPFEDIQYVATYSYNWPTAINDLQNHDSHILVTMISGNGNIVERCKTFSKVLQSILATSNCIGVYQGTQTLLIQKQQYLDKAEILKENTLPVQLWVYVGLRASGNGNSAYTYGLNYFGKQEMETIDSRLDLDALYELFCNISSYVINSDIRFKKGETLGYTTEQKIKITQSKGIYTEGQTLKLKL